MEISVSINPAVMDGKLAQYIDWLNSMGKKYKGFSVHVDVMREDFVGTNYISKEEYLYIMQNCLLPMDVHLMTHDTEFFIKNKSKRVWTVITPEGMINLDEQELKNTDPILVMSVQAGASGRPSDIPAALEKVKLLPGKKIILDGGINLDNIKQVKDAGVDVAVVGAALYNAPDREKMLAKLLSV